MGDKSSIEWTEATWNPIVGCSIVSPGCTNCYAMKQAHRIKKMTEGRTGNPEDTHYFGTTKVVNGNAVWTGEVRQAPEEILLQPLRWKRPRMIFVNSMADLFHESVPNEWIDRIFAVMALAPQQTFQVLTKRADRMRAYFDENRPFRIADAALTVGRHLRGGYPGWNCEHWKPSVIRGCPQPAIWPLPNVWLGVSAEDQKRADERIADLLATPAAVRWVSAEPLLGPIDFRKFMWPLHASYPAHFQSREDAKAAGQITNRRQALVHADSRFLDWIVVGGESGPGARPMHPDWARSIRDQCAAAGTPFFMKQWGEFVPAEVSGALLQFMKNDGSKAGFFEQGAAVLSRVGKKRAGRLLDGVTHDAVPEART